MISDRLKMQMTNTRLIAISFLLIILIGSVLLCFPFSSADGTWTPFGDCLFTATSATCVTGLVVRNTAVHWSLTGQIIILLMIQIGGLGFMTFLTLFSFFLHRQVSLHERRMLMQSAGALRMSGVMSTLRQITVGSLVVEALGAGLLCIRFYPMFGTKGVWYAVFHSVSAFCNAGFDILGDTGSSSFTSYVGDPLVNLTLMFLILAGGLGFLVWSDLLRSRLSFRRMELHTKLVLTVTAVLTVGGWIGFLLTERNAALAGLNPGEKLLAALFQSVTERTAGFNTVDQAALSNSGILLSCILMLIGGSPGSTAGGVKTTTVAVVLFSSLRLARNRDDVVLFRRRLDHRVVRQAGATVFAYFMMVLISTLVICAIEPFGLRDVLFETVSAIATVGLTTGITASLGGVSRLILIFLMYAGRLGGLSLFLALAENRNPPPLERPTGTILLG